MSEQGQAIIKDGVHNGVALGTHAATGNTLGAINDGLNLGKDALYAGQGIAHSSKKVHDPTVLLINLDGQYEQELINLSFLKSFMYIFINFTSLIS